jgi:SSS family transporter
MHVIDWIVLLGTCLFIVGYGIYKTRDIGNVKSYLLGDKDLPWWTIGLSIMATQASAITFLSTPGKAYEDGLGFAQFYFGLPVAMVILCIFVLPVYYRLNVYTAYEYLEQRFDIRVRTLTSILFLVQRGLAAGITIYAPAIILSNIMQWDLNLTILVTGAVVIFYTVFGGTKAVSVTQKQQMIIILTGMFIAAVIIVFKMPADVSFGDTLALAGKMEKLKVVDFTFDLERRYTFWSGMLGGVFLFLSYFGTDQSQVQRYLSGKSLTESRMGLLFNGMIKVPMQFLVLFVGILVFMFFQFQRPPIHFNDANIMKVQNSEYSAELEGLEKKFDIVFADKLASLSQLSDDIDAQDQSKIEESKQFYELQLAKDLALRAEVDKLILKVDDTAEVKDSDYVFIKFIINYLPVGMVGLLLAVIFSAAMSSTASELNALATTTVIDLYKRSINPNASDQHFLTSSKLFTIAWGVIALTFALVASLFDNLIEAVNIIGSIFYGTILGIFAVAFFYKQLTTGTKVIGIFTLGLFFGVVSTGFIHSAYMELHSPLLFDNDVPIILALMAIGGLIGYWFSDNFFKPIGGTSVFIGAFVAQLAVVIIFALNHYEVIELSYLWLNLIGCTLVIFISLLIQNFVGDDTSALTGS